MYDYMKALQRQFETDCQSIQNLNDEVNRTHKELSSRLAKEDRKLLLRLVDMEGNLRDHATLHSFTCGYRLAPVASMGNWLRNPRTPSPKWRKKEPAGERRLRTKATHPTKSNFYPGGEHSNGKTQTIW